MLEEIQEDKKEITTPDKILKKWKGKIENKSLEPSDLINYIQLSAPYFFTVTRKDNNISENSYCSFDEVGAKAAILDIIEEIILGPRYQETLKKLRAENNVSSICGNIFKNGEPTYSCRECSMDPTCVLCANCFKKSSHRSHKYRMSTSHGGGCCDCGDEEAWKKDYFCEDHTPAQKTDNESIITDDMKEVCNVVFQGVLAYCVNTLQIDSDTSYPDLESETDPVEDLFCTLLYNDETHTFDQVIGTLTSIVKCEQKEAVEYVTSIDRDGREIVKCATFAACLKLKNEVEKKGMRSIASSKVQPLRVAIFHKNTVACQSFALQMLHWFQEFLGYSAKFRTVFCNLILSAPSSSNYSLRQILLYDIKLWKLARSAWHRLLISAMLMEYENKRELAINFTKVYTNIMQDFLRDDHFHSFSVVSLSVQLFTVPTIAHHLMAHESAFFKLMHTYYSECIEKYIKNKVLVFPKNAASNFNKRAHYIITDLRYLLTFKPECWTQELRLGFLHGIQIVIRLLKSMQGMDAVTRQVGSHMEYEPEWESAFTLHIKLSSVISAIIDWCSTDKVILVKVYRMVLTALNESKFIVSNTSNEVVELGDHSANCLVYDVAAKPVSIHLPLSRFLAGLYTHFEKFNLTFENVSTTNEKPTLEDIIEPILCCRTMISQVYSGMWRRNGYSLLNQLFFYRNVKCRAEMLDRDIVILQMGASMIESNEFIIHILNKFNLITWTDESYKPVSTSSEEDTLRQIVNMVDECLELLIVIIGERYMEGVGKITDEQRVKKEIIQQLCIKPLSHSELNKALNDEHNYDRENDIEPVISELADFKKSADKKGVYNLKDEFYNEFNMYFYHYTKEEKSKSEEVMRQRKKTQQELICCPPPKLPQLTTSFIMIVNLLQCDSMLILMQNVLKQALDLNCQTFSESHVQKILHLIGYAIQEEDSGHYPFLTFMERSSRVKLLLLMEDLVSSPRIESQRDFLIYTIKKYKEQQTKSDNLQKPSDDVSMLPSSYEADSHSETEQAMKERRAKMAALRREQLMVQMEKAQKSFINNYAEHFKENEKSDEKMEWQPSVEEKKTSVCLGKERKIANSEAESFTCILCSEESSNNRDCIVYPAFIQRSSVLSRYQTTTEDTNQLSSIETTIHASPYVSSCGHEMHVSCWKEYFNNEILKEQRRPFRARNPSIFNIDKNQFLCPLCRFLSNAILPVVPPLHNLVDQKTEGILDDLFDFQKWYNMMNDYIKSLNFLKLNETESIEDGEEQTNRLFANYKDSIMKPLENYHNFDFSKVGDQINLNPETSDYILKFIKNVKEIATPQIIEDNGDIDSFSTAWKTCAYTVQSLEMYMRATDKPLKGDMSVRYEKCVSGLVRLCGFYGQFDGLPRKTPTIPNSYKSLSIYARSLFGNLFGDNQDFSIIHWDVFSMMTSMLFTTRPLLFPLNSQFHIPRGDSLDFTIFNTMFAANLMKIVVSVKLNLDIFMDIEEEAPVNEKTLQLIELYEKYNLFHIHEESSMTKSQLSSVLMQALKDQSRTFLRCSCILFNFLTKIPLPEEMTLVDTFEVMAKYLNLGVNILDYFEDSPMLKFMIQCAEHKAIEVYRNKLKSGDQNLVPIVPALSPIRQLVSLPEDYSDLINSVSSFTCKNNEREDSRNPTMCLVCGEIICSQTYCCQRELNKQQVGACNYHNEVCGAGAGIYLRIRDAEVLLLGQNSGCFLSAPYLDDYGETDQGLRRGHPLHLDHESYKKLQMLWLGNAIHEEIARKTEAQSHIFQIQWTHL